MKPGEHALERATTPVSFFILTELLLAIQRSRGGMRYPPAGERENPYYKAAMRQKEEVMSRNWYCAQKVNEKKVLFVNEATKRFFHVMLNGDSVVAISRMFFHLPKETGKRLTTVEQEALFQRMKKFIISEIGDYSYDGYPIRVYCSGAGYYIGCYCEDGPYCRLSEGYTDHQEEAWCYLYETYNSEQ